MPLPSNEERQDCAEKLHKRMLQEPRPEVAAVTESPVNKPLSD